jgi:hypothetical protein
VRPARRTTDDLTTARLTELTEEDIARAKALENCRKPRAPDYVGKRADRRLPVRLKRESRGGVYSERRI